MGTRGVTRPLLQIALILFLILLFNSHTALRSLRAVRKFDKARSRTHSYVADDIPNQLPGDYPPAAMVVRPTLDRYPLADDSAWKSSLAPSRGFIRLGPKGRPFGISLYHQLHCVNALRFAYTIARDGLVTDKTKLRKDLGHSDHCFQFVREGILCKGDLTLIPLDDESRSNKTYRTHRCRDWTKIREFVVQNIDAWRPIPLVEDPDFTSSTLV
ncbi:hypothetical protein BD779DRAFT_1785252 [Infundibulicybe gibba]|nr:hypothetical protein BD779DRAFT_1785252 [Infundibulicybe gibba]